MDQVISTALWPSKWKNEDLFNLQYVQANEVNKGKANEVIFISGPYYKLWTTNPPITEHDYYLDIHV